MFRVEPNRCKAVINARGKEVILYLRRQGLNPSRHLSGVLREETHPFSDRDQVSLQQTTLAGYGFPPCGP